MTLQTLLKRSVGLRLLARRGPGRSAGLAMIGEGILTGREVVCPEERGLVAPE